jgi:hypothetical protein
MARLDTELSSRTAIYIPLTMTAKADVRAALAKLHDIAGGATMTPARGVWRGGDGTMVYEGMEVVSWWTNRHPTAGLYSPFMPYLRVLVDLLLQHGEEAVMVEQGGYARIYKRMNDVGAVSNEEDSTRQQ